MGADADPEKEKDEKLSTLLGMVRPGESRCKGVSLVGESKMPSFLPLSPRL